MIFNIQGTILFPGSAASGRTNAATDSCTKNQIFDGVEMFTAILKGISLFLPYPALGLLISAGLTYLAIFFLPRFGFVDIPRGRHQHEKPIPRGGGIAIVTAFFLTVFLFRVSLIDKNIDLYNDIQFFFSKFWLPALIIFIIGVLDDRYELRSWFKLLFQIMKQESKF